MNKPKVSIIVPIYNVDNYLNQCIESILNQTFTDFELILVDDGSTDYSGKICDEYATKDKRIIVIHNQNNGVSVARNVGLEESQGEYVLFVDSDDYVDKKYVEKMISFLFEYDMVSCGFKTIQIGSESSHILTDSNKNIDVKDTFESIFSFTGMKGFLWNKAFKRKTIVENGIVFDSNIHMCEDQLFVIKYLQYCNRVLLIPDCLYFYRMRNSSIVLGKNFKKLNTIMDAYVEMHKVFKSNNIKCISFMYMCVWNYYEYKKHISNKYYVLLDIKSTKKYLYKTKELSIKKKIKLFIKIRIRVLYKIINRLKNNKMNYFN